MGDNNYTDNYPYPDPKKDDNLLPNERPKDSDLKEKSYDDYYNKKSFDSSYFYYALKDLIIILISFIFLLELSILHMNLILILNSIILLEIIFHLEDLVEHIFKSIFLKEYNSQNLFNSEQQIFLSQFNPNYS